MEGSAKHGTAGRRRRAAAAGVGARRVAGAMKRALMLTACIAMLTLAGGVYFTLGKPASPPPPLPREVAAHEGPQRLITGVTLSGLENYVLTPAEVNTMRKQIYACRYFWYCNTVRLQILQDKLIIGGTVNGYYLWAIRQLTDYGVHLGLTVVLNATTEDTVGYATDENLPNVTTREFWLTLGQYYGANRHVVFDLFNEPRRCTWTQWQAAFQQLITFLRAQGVINNFWVEGLWWADTFSGMPAPLRGTGIVYSFHHAGCPWMWQCPTRPATWNSAFGNLAAQGYPVVDGEITFYRGGYNFPGKGTLVQQYLAYLAAHHIGLLAWSLLPGVLNKPAGGFGTAVAEPQGAGQILRAWFKAHRGPMRPVHIRNPLPREQKHNQQPRSHHRPSRLGYLLYYRHHHHGQ